MIKKAILKFKDFELNVKGVIRSIVFGAGFKDEEFSGWKVDNGQLTLIHKDGSTSKLDYDPIDGTLKGNYAKGGTIQMYPPINFNARFKEFISKKREVLAEEKEKIVPKRNFAVISRNKYPALDSFLLKGKIRFMLDELFEAGYEAVIYSESMSEQSVLNLYDNRLDDTVLYGYNDYRKNKAYCITKAFWESIGNTVTHFNLQTFLQKYLETENIQEKYLETNN